MPPTRRGSVDTAESYGPMASYQHAIAQDEFWVSWDGGVAEQKAIAEMAPAYAINALHKLGRWMLELHKDATIPQFQTAEAKLYESSLVAALIEQALGAFYQNTFLVQVPDTPHVDDVVRAAEQADFTVGNLNGKLLSVSIDAVLELDNRRRESIGARALVLYEILTTPITTEEP